MQPKKAMFLLLVSQWLMNLELSMIIVAVVKSFHQRAHYGVEKTIAGISRRCDLSDLNSIAKSVVSCVVCQACKARSQKPAGHLQSLSIPNSIFQCISVDFLEFPKECNLLIMCGWFCVVCRLFAFLFRPRKHR